MGVKNVGVKKKMAPPNDLLRVVVAGLVQILFLIPFSELPLGLDPGCCHDSILYDSYTLYMRHCRGRAKPDNQLPAR